MSGTESGGEGGAPSLASNADYAAAWQRAYSGPTSEARRAGVRDMEVIASGGTIGRAASASPPPDTLPTPAYPVGQARDAAAEAVWARAADPSLTGPAHAAAVAELERHAATTPAAEPAPGAVPEGYEPPAGLAAYTVPGLRANDPDGLAAAQADMLAHGVPGWLGQTLLREGAATAALRTSDAAIAAGQAQARATLTKLHGPDEAVALGRDALALIDGLPARHQSDMLGLLVSPTVIQHLAQLHRLGGLPGKRG